MGFSPKAMMRLALIAAASGETQNFLGARWVPWLLKAVPRSWQRPLALRLLWLSPHYFFRKPEHSALSKSEFLELENRRNLESRRLIAEQLLAHRLHPESVCLDYGCGPGFLAVNVAPSVSKVIGCDISAGVLACAGAINHASNIEYRVVAGGGFPRPTHRSI